MRNVVNSREIARLWVNQSQEYARCPASMSFHGRRFLSYSTVIVEIVDLPSHGRVYFITDDRYSVTTERHKSKVRRAIPWGATVIEVPGVATNNDSGLADYERIIHEWENEIERLIALAASHNGRAIKKINLLRQADGILEKMRQLAKLFGKEKGIPKSIHSAYEYARWQVARKRLQKESFVPVPDLSDIVAHMKKLEPENQTDNAERAGYARPALRRRFGIPTGELGGITAMRGKPKINIFVRHYNPIYRKVVSEYWGSTNWHSTCKSAADSVKRGSPGPAGVTAHARDRVFARYAR